MSRLKLRELTISDQLQICKWRMTYNQYSRQSPLDNLDYWYEEQLDWYHSYDRATNHFFASCYADTEEIVGVTALTSIDALTLKAEIHHFIGENYIDPNKSKESVDLIKDYAFEDLKLHSLFVETFEHDTLKFNFFKDYGFYHVGTWPHKALKNTKDGLQFINVNIQTLIKDDQRY